jgi:hypothetical protein
VVGVHAQALNAVISLMLRLSQHKSGKSRYTCFVLSASACTRHSAAQHLTVLVLYCAALQLVGTLASICNTHVYTCAMEKAFMILLVKGNKP